MGKRVPFVAVFIFTLFSASIAINANPASAAALTYKKESSMTLPQKIASQAYYESLKSSCAYKNSFNIVTNIGGTAAGGTDQIENPTTYLDSILINPSGDSYVGAVPESIAISLGARLIKSNDGILQCADTLFAGLKLWTGKDYKSYSADDLKQFLGAMDYTSTTSTDGKTTTWTKNSGSTKSLVDIIKANVYNNTNPTLDNALKYYTYWHYLADSNQCNLTSLGQKDSLAQSVKDTIKDGHITVNGIQKYYYEAYQIVDSKGNIKLFSFIGNDYSADRNSVSLGSSPNYTKTPIYEVVSEGAAKNESTRECSYVASKLSVFAKDINGNTDKYSSVLGQLSVLYKKFDTTAAGTNDSSSTNTACKVEGVGWIICPIMTFMARAVDQTYLVVKDLLMTPPVNMIMDDSNPTYVAWSAMRSIANVVFVIGFLIIIFSQITSIGVTNYGIKKLLPKIIIAAILVNISYIICAIAVDLSNIIGSSIGQIFDTIDIKADLGGTTPFENTTKSILSGTIMVAGAGAAVLASGVTFMSAILFLASGLITVVTAILTVFLVLTMRQALIILLIVISPLAFVAFLLPNTSNWFKRWRETFTTMLLMFPIIALVFSASELAQKVVILGSADGAWAVKLMGLFIGIIPLAITPLVMKFAGGVLGKFGVMADNKNKGLFDRSRKAIDKRQELEGVKANNRAMNSSGKGLSKFRYGLRNRYLRSKADTDTISKYQQSEFENAKSAYVAGEITKPGSALLEKASSGGTDGAKDRIMAAAESELKKGAQPAFQRKIADVKVNGFDTGRRDASGRAIMSTDVDDYLDMVAKDGNRSWAERAVAIDHAAKIGRDNLIRKWKGSGTGVDQRILQESISDNFSSLVGVAPDLVKGEKSAFIGGMTGDAFSKLSKDTAGAYMNYLNELQNTSVNSTITATERAKAAEDYKDAISAFNNAIKDIQSTPSLQSSFRADTGKAMVNTFDISNPSRIVNTTLESDLAASGLGVIRANDGKIRP